MAPPNSVSESLQKFFSETFFIEFGGDVGPDTNLFEAGLLNSFGFIELVTFIEKSYGVTLNDADFESPEISRLSGLERIIVSRMGTTVE